MSIGKPSLLWVHYGSLVEDLGRATWLETSKEFCNYGWQVTLVASGFPQSEVDGRIRAIRLAQPKIYLIGYLVFHFHLLYRIISDWPELDIILFHQFSALFLLPLALLRNLFRQKLPKIVMDSRDLAVEGITIRSKIWVLYFRFVNKLACWLADGQTAITVHMAREVGIPNRQLLGVWPSGVKTEQFCLAISLRRWPGLAEPLRLIYIGTLNEQRNLLALCQAVRLARAEGLNVTLTFVGKGPLQAELERYSIQEGSGGIMVKPAVPYSEVVRVLGNADVGVLPFLDLPHWRIASFIKMFEYLAAGMPILATRIVSHTDVLAGEYVFWAEDGSPMALAAAIREACAHKMKLSDMGSKAAVAAKDWSWDKSSKKLDIALRRILTDKL